MYFKQQENDKNDWILNFSKTESSEIKICGLEEYNPDLSKAVKLTINLNPSQIVHFSEHSIMNLLSDQLSKLEHTTEIVLSDEIQLEGYEQVILLLRSIFKYMPSIAKLTFDQETFSPHEDVLNSLFDLIQSLKSLRSVSLDTMLSSSFKNYLKLFDNANLKELSFCLDSSSNEETDLFNNIIAPRIAQQIEKLSFHAIDEDLSIQFFAHLATSNCLKHLELALPLSLVNQAICELNKINTLSEIGLCISQGFTLIDPDSLNDIMSIELPSLTCLRVSSYFSSQFSTSLVKKIMSSTLNIKELVLSDFSVGIELLELICDFLNSSRLEVLKFKYSINENKSDPFYTIFCAALFRNTSLRIFDVSQFSTDLINCDQVFYKSIAASRLEHLIFNKQTDISDDNRAILATSQTLLSLVSTSPNEKNEIGSNIVKKKQMELIVSTLGKVTIEVLNMPEKSWDIFNFVKDRINELSKINYPYSPKLWDLFNHTFISYYAENYNTEHNPDYLKFALRNLYNMPEGSLSTNAIYQISCMLSRATEEDAGLDTGTLNMYSLAILSKLDKSILENDFQERIRFALILCYERSGKSCISWDMKMLTGKKIVITYSLFIEAIKSIKFGMGHQEKDFNLYINSLSNEFDANKVKKLVGTLLYGSEQNEQLENYLGYPISDIAILEDIINSPEAYPLKDEKMIACDDAQWQQFALYQREMLGYFQVINDATNLTSLIESIILKGNVLQDKVNKAVHSEDIDFELIILQINSLTNMIKEAFRISKSKPSPPSINDMLSPTVSIIENSLKMVASSYDSQKQSATFETESDQIKEAKQEVGINVNSQTFFNTPEAIDSANSKRKLELNEDQTTDPNKQTKI